VRFQQHRDASSHQFFFLQGKAPKEIHAILTETLACFLPGRARDLSAPLYYTVRFMKNVTGCGAGSVLSGTTLVRKAGTNSLVVGASD